MTYDPQKRADGLEADLIETIKERDALKASIKKLLADNRWIPVTERLPKPLMPSDRPLTVWLAFQCDGNRMERGIWHGDGDGDVTCFWVGEIGWNTNDDFLRVTHWRPLPAPPEQVADK